MSALKMSPTRRTVLTDEDRRVSKFHVTGEIAETIDYFARGKLIGRHERGRTSWTVEIDPLTIYEIMGVDR